MTDQSQPSFSATIAFTADEAHWLYQALESSKKVIVASLFEKGTKPTDDQAYAAYDVLAERCLAFWMVHGDPNT